MMSGKVIQGYFVNGRPKVPPSLQPKWPPPPIQPKTTVRPPGPPAPAFNGHMFPPQPRLPGPPAPAFARPQATVQPHGAADAFQVDVAQLGLASGSGRPLPDVVRSQMEAALGADFANVRVHVGPQAERIGAIAFTLGSDIYFAPGRYQPETGLGQQVLGHELAHVLQQRAGRVRNPMGAGVAVVQDRALEAEADRLGHRAAGHRIIAQPEMPPGAVQASPRVQISAPVPSGRDRYRLTAAAAGHQVGSVMVHAREKGAVEVTDLGVDPAHRERGIGKMLLASAARTGLRAGKYKVTLAAQDNGSGHLTRWYKTMGFAQVGMNGQGYPQLEAPIARLLNCSHAVQPLFPGRVFPPIGAGPQDYREATLRLLASSSTSHQGSAAGQPGLRLGPAPAVTAAKASPNTVQRMKRKKESAQVTAEDKARMIVAHIFKENGTDDNWTVGVLQNGDLIISKVNGVTASHSVLPWLKKFIEENSLEDGIDIYLAQTFNNVSSRHAEMCVLAAADAMEETLTFMICVAPNCDFCAQTLEDFEVPSAKHQGNNPTSQQGWTHPRYKVGYGTQLAASLSSQLSELHDLNLENVEEDEITKGQKLSQNPAGRYTKWL